MDKASRTYAWASQLAGINELLPRTGQWTANFSTRLSIGFVLNHQQAKYAARLLPRGRSNAFSYHPSAITEDIRSAARIRCCGSHRTPSRPCSTWERGLNTRPDGTQVSPRLTDSALGPLTRHTMRLAPPRLYDRDEFEACTKECIHAVIT